jgi:hypothetical protein
VHRQRPAGQHTDGLVADLPTVAVRTMHNIPAPPSS